MQRNSCLFCLLALLLLSKPAFPVCDSDPDGTDIIGMYAAGWTPALKSYHMELLSKALDYSVPEYGKYRLVLYTRKLTVEREIAEVERGELFQIVFLSQARFKNNTHGKAIDLSFPLHRGLLGLRKLIIRKSDSERFKHTKSKREFYKLKVGQGLQWPDVHAYRNAGIHVVGGVNTEKLLVMLTMGRFDYFPLSILEIDEFIEEHSDYRKVLDIHEGAYIFYPMPIHITVTKACEKIARRVDLGISTMKKKGELDKIFKKYFNQKLVELSDSQNVVFILKNPLFSDEENNLLSKTFISKFLSKRANIVTVESD